MGRAVLGLFLGFAMVFGVIYWAQTCLPDPNDRGIEWLRRADVIVVQIKVVADTDDEFAQGLTVPEFTLYGDGTVITDGRRTPYPGGPHGPLKGHLSAGAIQSLLKVAKDRGFFDFAYEQPPPAGTDGPTTYVYVNSKLEANAVFAYDLLSEAPKGSEWDQFRRLQQIVERLISVGDDPVPYFYDSIAFVARTASPVEGLSPFDLPDEIDVSAVTPESGVVTQTVTGQGMRELMQNLEPGTEALAGDDRGTFAVAYRPVLPYEENFPEFEPPTQ